MKTYLRIGILLLLSILIIQPVQGQKLLNRIAKKAQEKVEQKMEEKVEEKVEEKIDEKIDEQLNEAEDAESENESDSEREARTQQRMQGMLKGLGISGDPVPIADNYNFDHLIQMHIESFDNSGNKTSTGEFITHLNPKSKSMAYQVVSGDMANEGQGMFIIDAENQATIILSEEEGKKTGIVYGMGAFMESMGEEYQEEELEDSPEMYMANPNVKKTGKTKTIAGYKCEEYIYTDEESVSDIWITKDLKMNTQDFFSTLFKTSMYSQGIGWGYLMEVTTEDKTNGEKTMMQVTKVDSNSNVHFSMSDYQITNLGSFTMPAEE